ncbi:class I SAM-dependent methyltransferase [Caballeronia sp.]|uniref:class I SAM-dependent methyltransferase n=1 Tax=Caballeronia sp. TaxID=1931223 RepID=UPI003C3CD0A1
MEQDEFSAFERRGWETVAQPYHSYFGELTTQSNDALLDALEVRTGVRFLDIASGPGYLAAAAARRGAHVVGVDFADAMVQQARRIFPDLTFRPGSAEDLPFPDMSFVVNISPLRVEAGRKGQEGYIELEIPQADEEGLGDAVAARNVAGIYGRMADDLRHGTRTAPGFNDALDLHKVLSAIERSDQTGRRVRVG